MTRRARLACPLAVLLTACDEARAPLDLDELLTSDRECVEVVHESLDLGGPVVAFASDIAGSPGGWALVSTVIDSAPVLAIVRVPARDDEPITEPIVVSYDPADASLFELRAGFELGSAWLVRPPDTSQPGPVVLRELRPGVGVVASNDKLANFPADDDTEGCPNRWSRQLLLIEDRPYMLAVPDCSEGPDLELQLLSLDEQTLGYGINWTLYFDPCADLDPVACAQVHAYRLEAIGPGQSTHWPEDSWVEVGLTVVRAYDEGISGGAPSIRSSDISLLDLRFVAGEPEAQIWTFRDVWVHITPFELGPVELAEDQDWMQIFVPNPTLRSESMLVRYKPHSTAFYLATGEDVLPYAGQGSLVQLDRTSAMVDLDDLGRLRATPLDHVPVWGSFDSQPIYEQPELIGFESAGPGMLLLRREGLPEQLLHVACVPDQDE